MLPDAFEGPLTDINAPPSPVYLLKVRTQEGSKYTYNPTIYGLVLKKISEAVYTRLGLFLISRSDKYWQIGISHEEVDRLYEEEVKWVNNPEYQTITLI